MDLLTLLAQMREDGAFQTIGTNPLAQFGRRSRRYLGATILPERMVPRNAFREEAIKYRTVVANAGGRYSPAQKKDGDLVGSFLVELGESDIAREFTGERYDALLEILQRNASMEGVVSLTNWLDTTINLALVELNEKQIWQALVAREVVRVGDNGYQETVTYPNPTGHIIDPGDVWSEPTHDPFEDLAEMADFLAGKGYTPSRIITGRQVLSAMTLNPNVKARVGVAVINNGTITSAAGRASLEAINGVLEADGLPALEVYDLQYRTETGTDFFLNRQALVMLGATGRDEEIDLGDNEPLFMSDTLGYMAVGRGVGQAQPGRVIRMEPKMDKPPRIEAEGWQTSLPVVTEPEAWVTLKDILGG